MLWGKLESKVLEGKEGVYVWFTLCPQAPEQWLAYMRCSVNICWDNLSYNLHSATTAQGQETPLPTSSGPFPVKPPPRPPVTSASSLTSYNPDCHFASEHLWCYLSSLQEPFTQSLLSIYQCLAEGKEHFLSLHSVKHRLFTSCGYNPFALWMVWLLIDCLNDADLCPS